MIFREYSIHFAKFQSSGYPVKISARHRCGYQWYVRLISSADWVGNSSTIFFSETTGWNFIKLYQMDPSEGQMQFLNFG